MSSDLVAVARNLASAINPTSEQASQVNLRRRQAVVTAVAAGRASVAVGGNTASPIGPLACLSPYLPIVGDTVWVDFNGPDPMVIGTAEPNLGPVYVRLRNGSSITAPTRSIDTSNPSDFVFPVYDQVDADPYNMFTAGTIWPTVTRPGWYVAVARAVWDPSGAGARRCVIRHRESFVWYADQTQNPTPGGSTRMMVQSELMWINAGESVQALWLQSSGGDLALQSARISYWRQPG